MMSASREKSETAELLEMVQKVSDSSRSPSPRAIQSALAKPRKSRLKLESMLPRAAPRPRAGACTLESSLRCRQGL